MESSEDSIKFLNQLCGTSSQSRDSYGVNHAQQIIARQLIKMGFEVEFLPNQEKETGDLLHGFLKGKGNKQISIVCHADCVRAWNDDDRLVEKQELLIGPGVADDKGGVTVALRGLWLFLKQCRPDFSIHFVCSPSEELGSIGFHDFYRKVGKSSSYIFGFEPALENGAPITSRFGNRWYRVTVTGESSHAGRVGRAERNAAHELAAKISRLHELHDPDQNIKVNVGSFSGGHGEFNTTCGRAEALIDTRFNRHEQRDELHEKILALFDTPLIGSPDHLTCTWSIEDDCPPLGQNDRSDAFVEQYMNKLKELEGKQYQLAVSGGAADVNYFCHPDAVTIDGLGPIGLRLHRKDEAVVKSSLETRAKAFSWLLEKIS